MNFYNMGPLEQEVMEYVWGKREASVSDVHKHFKRSRKIAYTTLMTVMARLVDKGYLTRKKQGKAYLYYPKKTKGQTAKGEIKRIVDSLVDHYGKEAVTAFTDELKKHRQ